MMFDILYTVSLALQVIYFLLVSILEVVDTVPFLKQMTSLRKQADNIRKHLFVSLVFPITLCAGVTFWIVYAYDREQIYPSGLDKIIQPWINHSIHTIPPVLVFIHMFLADLTGISTPLCLKLLLCFNVLYSTCFIWSGLVYGNWIYLICQAMGAKKLAIVLSVCNLSTGIYFAIGRLLPSYIKSINKHKENNTRKVK
ncbi:androgen-induced gene 1 protein-like isoform X2 [Lycorma delicatula]|uniref:androgen-induced gene 1 protein-like isoform X2 n=1 Tax=Lycorma delicatula TaxID=130591 RepID=UPI003F51301F